MFGRCCGCPQRFHPPSNAPRDHDKTTPRHHRPPPPAPRPPARLRGPHPRRRPVRPRVGAGSCGGQRNRLRHGRTADLGSCRGRVPGDGELEPAAGSTRQRRLPGRGRGRGDAHRLRRQLGRRIPGHRHPGRVRRAARNHPGKKPGAVTATRDGGGSRLRASPLRYGLGGGRPGREGLAGVVRHLRDHSDLRHAGRGRRRGQGLHGAGRALRRRGRGGPLAPREQQ